MISQTDQHALHVMRLVETGAAVHSEIVASWDRCVKLHKLNPDTIVREAVLTDGALRAAFEPVERYMLLAEAELQNLARHVAKAGFFLSVADSQGVALIHLGALPEIGFQNAKARDGMVWREDLQGTNAIGTGLFSGQPVAIHQGEHFYGAHVAMTCLATPFYGPSGGMLGALNIATLNPHFERVLVSALLALLVATAQRIEAIWFQDAFQRALVVSLPEAASAGGSIPLLAVDHDFNIVGASHAARVQCRLTDAAIEAGLALDRVMPGFQAGQASLWQAERAAVQRALALSGQNVSRAASQLGVSRATMHRKMALLDVSRRQRPRGKKKPPTD
jgi:transcriptional regulator of acetoin/glycerol metabolism